MNGNPLPMQRPHGSSDPAIDNLNRRPRRSSAAILALGLLLSPNVRAQAQVTAATDDASPATARGSSSTDRQTAPASHDSSPRLPDGAAQSNAATTAPVPTATEGAPAASASPAAHAPRPTPSPADVTTAEALGARGAEAFEAAQYAQAAAHFEEAFALTQWPTAGLWWAKALNAQGQQAHAVAVLLATQEVVLPADAPEVLSQAQQQARQLAEELRSQVAVVSLIDRPSAARPLELLANGQVLDLSAGGHAALEPGRYQLEVRSKGTRLWQQELALNAGAELPIKLDETVAAPASSPTPETPRKLSLSSRELQGWEVRNAAGEILCTLPCDIEWAPKAGYALTNGQSSIPLRPSRRLLKRSELVDVTLEDQRGSRGWALGLGITSASLALLSLAASSQATVTSAARTSYQGGAAVFLVGAGACGYWYVWSKSQPYLEYRRGQPQQQAQLGVGWSGAGLQLIGQY